MNLVRPHRRIELRAPRGDGIEHHLIFGICEHLNVKILMTEYELGVLREPSFEHRLKVEDFAEVRKLNVWRETLQSTLSRSSSAGGGAFPRCLQQRRSFAQASGYLGDYTDDTHHNREVLEIHPRNHASPRTATLRPPVTHLPQRFELQIAPRTVGVEITRLALHNSTTSVSIAILPRNAKGGSAMTTHLFDRLEFPGRDIALDTRVAIHIEDGEPQDRSGTPLERWSGKWELTVTIDEAAGAALRRIFDDDEDEAAIAEVRLKEPVGGARPPRASGEVVMDLIDEDQGVAALRGTGPLMFVDKKG